jgi:hypothetical protein
LHALTLFSFYSGTADLLSFVRNADYAQLSEQIHSGAKRTAGSFSEPAALGVYACVLLGFWSLLWMQHYRPRLSGPLAFATLYPASIKVRIERQSG